MSPTRPLAVLRAALVVAASYGCAAKNNAAPGVQCSTSSQCSGGRACVAGMCVTGAAARPLDVEIVPNDSPNAPTTEVRLTMVDPQHVGLSADRPGALRVSVAYPPGSVLPSRANIVVAV